MEDRNTDRDTDSDTAYLPVCICTEQEVKAPKIKIRHVVNLIGGEICIVNYSQGGIAINGISFWELAFKSHGPFSFS